MAVLGGRDHGGDWDRFDAAITAIGHVISLPRSGPRCTNRPVEGGNIHLAAEVDLCARWIC